MKDRPTITIDPTTGYTIALLGSSKQGKTTMLLELYRQHFRKKYICILCSPNCSNKIYKDHKLIKCDNILTMYTLIEIASELQRNSANRYKFCFIFDDVIDQSRSKMLSNLILTMRNLNISTMISVQDPTLFSKAERNSINSMVIFRFLQPERRYEVCKNFIGMRFGTRKIDDRARKFDEYTANHACVHIDCLREKIEKCKLQGFI